MTILDEVRDWLKRDGKKWNVAGERAQIYRLRTGVLVYWLRSTKIGFWGLNGSVVARFRNSGLMWKVVLVSVDESAAFVLDGNDKIVVSLHPNKRGHFLLHENTELKNSKKLRTVAEIMKEIVAEEVAAKGPRSIGVAKYGPGGEGVEHRRLKEWIFAHPEFLGFPLVLAKRMEYGFLTGDRVDLMFDLPGDRFATVEIETNNPLPGAFQALKYKVLKCAEIGADIKSDKVEAILVAWMMPEDAGFCGSYDVRFVEKRL